MNKYAAVTRSIIGWGVVAGPFYLILGIGQGLLREGFDFSRHALSHLVNGPWGWLQTANLILSGLMVIAAAIGIERVFRPRRTMCLFLSLFGLGMILAAAFPADPVDGFPPGTPVGAPTAVSTVGILHFVFAGLGFISLMVSCFVGFFTFRKVGESTAAGISLGAGILVLLGFFGGPALGPAGIIGIWIAVVTGWVWLAIVSLKVYKMAPHPDHVAE